MTRIGPVLLALLVIGAAGCAPEPPEPIVIEITCDRFAADPGDQIIINRHVQAEVGTTIILRLCDNPSTGFRWEDAGISDTTVVVESFRESLEPESTVAPGTPSLEQWTLDVVGEGECTISFSYDRPWDGGEKGARQFNLYITVV